MGSISVEELARSPARLIEEAESGEVAVVTKDGRPLFLAVPCDERLAKGEVHVGALKIPVARYSSDELSREIGEFG